jgi:hypothetical protein
MDGDTLTLELVGDVLHVKGLDCHFKLHTQPADDFPPVDRTRTPS